MESIYIYIYIYQKGIIQKIKHADSYASILQSYVNLKSLVMANNSSP